MLAEKSGTVLSPTYTLDACNTMYETWKKSFEDFQNGEGALQYPPGWNNEEFPLALHPSMSVSCQKKMLYDYLRRLHPDKFNDKNHGHLFQAQEMKKLKEDFESITRKCNDLLEALRNEDVCGKDVSVKCII